MLNLLPVWNFGNVKKASAAKSSWARCRRPCCRLPKKRSARRGNCAWRWIPKTASSRPSPSSLWRIARSRSMILAFAKLIVADRVVSQHDQISVFDARRLKADAKVGDEIEKEVTPAGFGRVAAQYAKQALMQKVRQAEKAMIMTEFKDRVGDIVSGTVRRFDRSDVILDLGKYEALMPNKERVPTEEYQVGERIRCYVKAVQEGPHGPEIILSRADTRFI